MTIDSLKYEAMMAAVNQLQTEQMRAAAAFAPPFPGEEEAKRAAAAGPSLSVPTRCPPVPRAPTVVNVLAVIVR